MALIIYCIALPICYIVSILPFPLLYGLSTGFYYLLFRVIGYRKEVVYKNLRNAFPEKSEQEIKAIADQFFRYFCDLVAEVLKNITISPQTALKRCSVSKETVDLFNSLAAENQSAIIVMGHKGNWEWAGNSFSLTFKHTLHVVYHPLKNKYFDRLIYKMRTKYGTQLIKMKQSFDRMKELQHTLHCVALIADQSPRPQNAYWLNFLNQDTGVYLGTEKYALESGYPVIYLDVYRLKRGYYELRAELLETEHATGFGAITSLHVAILEKKIREQPYTWMWTHKRWKHRRPPVHEMSWYKKGAEVFT